MCFCERGFRESMLRVLLWHSGPIKSHSLAPSHHTPSIPPSCGPPPFWARPARRGVGQGPVSLACCRMDCRTHVATARLWFGAASGRRHALRGGYVEGPDEPRVVWPRTRLEGAMAQATDTPCLLGVSGSRWAMSRTGCRHFVKGDGVASRSLPWDCAVGGGAVGPRGPAPSLASTAKHQVVPRTRVSPATGVPTRLRRGGFGWSASQIACVCVAIADPVWRD